MYIDAYFYLQIYIHVYSINLTTIFIHRMKDVQQKRYTRDESEMGAGKSVEILSSVNALRGAAMESI
jgi:hypothetical protein